MRINIIGYLLAYLVPLIFGIILAKILNLKIVREIETNGIIKRKLDIGFGRY